jgi:hypothetical protein
MPDVPSTPIAIGSLAWGTPVNDRFANVDRAKGQLAVDQDFITWQFDPATNMVGTALTSGTVNMSKLWIRQAATITNVCVALSSTGVGLVAGQNFGGLYDAAGTRLGVTADQTVAWGTAGFKEMALTAPVPVTPGYYYVAVVCNAGTVPPFCRGSAITASVPNAKLTATNGRFTTGPTAQTSLPASITMASRTLTANTLWVAVS